MTAIQIVLFALGFIAGQALGTLLLCGITPAQLWRNWKRNPAK